MSSGYQTPCYFRSTRTLLSGLQRYRFQSNIWGDIHYSTERQPSCRRAATDYQWVDPDDEESPRRFGALQQDLGGISWWVWISDRQRQLLAGTGQGLPFRAARQSQTQSWGNEMYILKTPLLPCWLCKSVMTDTWAASPYPFKGHITTKSAEIMLSVSIWATYKNR